MVTEARKRRYTTISFLVMITGSFLSYTSASMGIIKIGGYLLTIIGMSFLVCLWPIKSLNKSTIVVLFSGTIAFISFLSVFLSSGIIQFVDLQYSLIYPVVIVIIILYGYRIAYADTAKVGKLLLLFAYANAAVALLGSFGLVSSLPIFGEIETGRYIFGTTIASSAGLNDNVNYYATTQATIAIFYLLLVRVGRERIRKTDIVHVILISAFSLLGSSRGVLIGILATICVVTAIHFFYLKSLKKLSITLGVLMLLLPVVVWCLYNYKSLYEFIMLDLRFIRGLNGREDIWGIWFRRFIERPIFGWGTMDIVASDFIETYGYSRSFHNSYLTVLYRGGVSLFLATYGLMAVVIIYNIRKVKDYFYANRYCMGIIAFYLINSMVRNFSFGGIGLLPLTFGIALSICFYSNEIPQKSTNRIGMY